MSLSTGSVKVNLSTTLQGLFRREDSHARRFLRETGVTFYNHMNNIARAAVAMNGCASTGIVVTVQRKVSSAAASSAGLRCVLTAGSLATNAASFYVRASSLGLSKFLYGFAQPNALTGRSALLVGASSARITGSTGRFCVQMWGI